MHVGSGIGKSVPQYSEVQDETYVVKSVYKHCLEIASKLIYTETVPQTDSGGRGEYPQVFERTLVKELGKITP